jgi:diadenylate cyclase
MTFMQDLWLQVSKMKWSDYLDIILVAVLICRLLPTLRTTGAARIAKLVVLVLAFTWITDLASLNTLNFLLEELLSIGLIAVIVLYQPELRRILDRLSNVKLDKWMGLHHGTPEDVDPVIRQTVMACEVMSREHVGALIVFSRQQPLEEFYKSGTRIDAQVSEQLIRNIFFPKASLHDGAMIIENGRVAAAGCVLPLSDTHRLSADLGTRHRAGVGMSEASDAVVVIVSEETGTISVAVSGMLKRHLAPQTLEKLLRSELCKEEEAPRSSLKLLLQQKLSRNDEKGERK